MRRSARDLGQSGLGWSELDLLRAKVVCGLGGAVIAAALAAVLPTGPLTIVAAGYAGFIAPSVWVGRLASSRREAADRALVVLVEWTEALVASGRPVESALAAVAERGVGTAPLDTALAAVARSYALGAPLFASLARDGHGANADLARRLEDHVVQAAVGGQHLVLAADRLPQHRLLEVDALGRQLRGGNGVAAQGVQGVQS